MLFSYHKFLSEKTTWFKPSSLFRSFLKSEIGLFSSKLSLKIKHGSNQLLYIQSYSKWRLHYSVLNFLWKDSIVPTNYSLSKFTQKWDYVAQLAIFSEKTTWFKPNSPLVDFLKNDITLFSSEIYLKRQHGLK